MGVCLQKGVGMLPWYGWVLVVAGALGLAAWWFRQWFRRDPDRVIPPGQVIVSPADGRVLDVREISAGPACPIRKGRLGQVEAVTDDLGEGPFVLISIFMNLFDVHVNRSPLAGQVVRVEHHPGRLRRANHPRALENEKTETVLQTPIGRVKILQIAGLVARRVDNWLGIGQRLNAGERIGLIHFGSQVSLILPNRGCVRLSVTPGQKVRAGESVLGTYVPEA